MVINVLDVAVSLLLDHHVNMTGACLPLCVCAGSGGANGFDHIENVFERLNTNKYGLKQIILLNKKTSCENWK